MRRARAFFVEVPVLLGLLSLTGSAGARSGGLAALGCDGCHNGGQPATVTLTADRMNPGVGEPITLTIAISQANGANAGFYLTTAYESLGAFRAVEAGTALNSVDSSGVLHTTPRTGSGGTTTFKAEWTASQATGVTFDVFALSGNADRSNRGDGAGVASLALAVGCVGQRYYIDQDGDGYGSDDPAFRWREGCALPAGYADKAGDCNDFRADVHPGAAELCDLLDNDCDDQVDDDVVSQLFCQDRDGDGHGVVGGTTKMDCKPTPGFGACDGDCDDGDKLFAPGAEEVCDLRDNDCDGEVDEDVRPICGVGFCARRGRGCGEADCTPGDPLPETCNGYDDDCDGVVDNGDSTSLCGEPNARCSAGRCLGADGNTAGAPPSGASGSNSASGQAGLGGSGSGSDGAKPSSPGCSVLAGGLGARGVLGLGFGAVAWSLRRRWRAAVSRRGR
jgi:Putative metal-binding motif